MTREAINELKKYTLGKKNTEKVEISVLQLNRVIKALEQEPILDKIRAEIAEYGSIWVEYKITGRRDKDIEQLVSDVLSQAKKQVLEVIDKYKVEVRGE